MPEKCPHYNVGYCKFEEKCKMQHNKEECNDSECDSKMCPTRHRKSCKYENRCKYKKQNVCEFWHKDGRKDQNIHAEDKAKQYIEYIRGLRAEIMQLNMIIAKQKSDLENLNARSGKEISMKEKNNWNDKFIKDHAVLNIVKSSTTRKVKMDGCTKPSSGVDENVQQRGQMKCQVCDFMCKIKVSLNNHIITKHGLEKALQILTTSDKKELLAYSHRNKQNGSNQEYWTLMLECDLMCAD